MKNMHFLPLRELEEIFSLVNEIEEGQKKLIVEYSDYLEKQKTIDGFFSSYFSFLAQKKEEYEFFGDDREAHAVIYFIEEAMSKLSDFQANVHVSVVSKDREAEWKNF